MFNISYNKAGTAIDDNLFKWTISLMKSESLFMRFLETGTCLNEHLHEIINISIYM